MTFATRSDLLARSNARRLAQLAVPADVAMPPDDALRTAIAGGSLAALTAAEQAAVALALDAIDKALADAGELVISHGIPATASSPLLARLCSTIALYYLHGPEHMIEDVRLAYEACVKSLKSHASGEINLLPVVDTVPPMSDDQVQFASAPRRYGITAPVDAW